ncbi:hypothetical protein [Bosea minatitlanensis]|uniref:Uncharacterized protein n=1 Tax=Bosea minatitlanensis TaxID=128782 RepID=A0ABW0EX62_9HYPH|nr:hypothetical protein [Bosea minatitlanensis]MCT4496046.1 hypothetical protein [Bosea minatitlanensis]
MRNGSFGVYEDPVLMFRRFDAMPAELRRVHALAPYHMHMGKAAKRLDVYRSAGASVANMRTAEIFLMCRLIQEEATRLYGPEHPDAQRSRLEGRARRAMRGSTAGGGRA